MTITDKLEGLLPADGNLTTKDERVIAEAVASLSEYDWMMADMRQSRRFWRNRATSNARLFVPVAALAFAAGCIASAIYVVLV